MSDQFNSKIRLSADDAVSPVLKQIAANFGVLQQVIDTITKGFKGLDLSRFTPQINTFTSNINTVAAAGSTVTNAVNQAGGSIRTMATSVNQAIPGINNLVTLFRGLGNVTRGLGTGNFPLIAMGATQVTQAFAAMGPMIIGVAAGVGILLGALLAIKLAFNAVTGAIGFVIDKTVSFVKTGLDFNKTLESGRIGIAALIVTADRAVGKTTSFADAMSIAADAQKKLQAAAFLTNATFMELQAGFEQITSASAGQTATIDDLIKLTTTASNMASTLGIQSETAFRQFTLILEGVGRTTGRVAAYLRTLGIDNKTIQTWREQGVAIQKLTEVLVDFQKLGPEIQGSWKGVTSNLEDIWQQASKIATTGLFDNIKTQLKGVISEFVIFDEKGNGFLRPEVVARLEEFGRDLVDIARHLAPIIIDMGKLAISAAEGITKVAKFFASFVDGSSLAIQGVKSLIESLIELKNLIPSDEDKAWLSGTGGAGRYVIPAGGFPQRGSAVSAPPWAVAQSAGLGIKLAGDPKLASVKQLAQELDEALDKVLRPARLAGLSGYARALQDVRDKYADMKIAAEKTFNETVKGWGALSKAERDAAQNTLNSKLSLLDSGKLLEMKRVTDAATAQLKELGLSIVDLDEDFSKITRHGSMESFDDDVANIGKRLVKLRQDLTGFGNTDFDISTYINQLDALDSILKSISSKSPGVLDLRPKRMGPGGPNGGEDIQESEATLVRVSTQALGLSRTINDYVNAAIAGGASAARAYADAASKFYEHANSMNEGFALASARILGETKKTGQSVSDYLVKVWHATGQALDDAFFNILKGKFSSLKDIFSSLNDAILHSFTTMLSEMVMNFSSKFLNKLRLPGRTKEGGQGGSFVDGKFVGPEDKQPGIGADFAGAAVTLGASALQASGLGHGTFDYVGTGAALGNMAYPGWGALIGAVVGLIAGLLQASQGEIIEHVFAGRGNLGTMHKIDQSFSLFTSTLADMFRLGAPDMAHELVTAVHKSITDLIKNLDVVVHAGSQNDFDADLKKLVDSVLPKQALHRLFGNPALQGMPGTFTPHEGLSGNLDVFDAKQFDANSPIPRLLTGLGFTANAIRRISMQIDQREVEDFMKWLGSLVEVVAGFNDLSAKFSQSSTDVFKALDAKASESPAVVFGQTATKLKELAYELNYYIGEDQINKAKTLIDLANKYYNDQLQYMADLRQMVTSFSASIRDQFTAMGAAFDTTAQGQARLRNRLTQLMGGSRYASGSSEGGLSVGGDYLYGTGLIKNAGTPQEAQKFAQEAASIIKQLFDHIVEVIKGAQTLVTNLGDLKTKLLGVGTAAGGNSATSLSMDSDRIISQIWAAIGIEDPEARLEAISKVHDSAMEFYQQEVTFLANARNILASITESIENQAKSMERRLMTLDQRNAADWATINGTSARLAGAGSPEEVQRILGETGQAISEIFDNLITDLENARNILKQINESVATQLSSFADRRFSGDRQARAEGILNGIAGRIPGATSATDIQSIMNEAIKAAGELFDILLARLKEAQQLLTENEDIQSKFLHGPEKDLGIFDFAADAMKMIGDVRAAQALSGQEQIDAIRKIQDTARARYEAEQAFIKQIDSTVKSITQSFADQRKEMQFAALGEDPNAQIAFLKNDIITNQAALRSAMTPEDVQKFSSIIQEDVRHILRLAGENAKGLGSGDPNAFLPELMRVLNDTEGLAKQRLAGMKSAIEDSNRIYITALQQAGGALTSETVTINNALDDLGRKMGWLGSMAQGFIEKFSGALEAAANALPDFLRAFGGEAKAQVQAFIDKVVEASKRLGENMTPAINGANGALSVLDKTALQLKDTLLVLEGQFTATINNFGAQIIAASGGLSGAMDAATKIFTGNAGNIGFNQASYDATGEIANLGEAAKSAAFYLFRIGDAGEIVDEPGGGQQPPVVPGNVNSVDYNALRRVSVPAPRASGYR